MPSPNLELNLEDPVPTPPEMYRAVSVLRTLRGHNLRETYRRNIHAFGSDFRNWFREGAYPGVVPDWERSRAFLAFVPCRECAVAAYVCECEQEVAYVRTSGYRCILDRHAPAGAVGMEIEVCDFPGGSRSHPFLEAHNLATVYDGSIAGNNPAELHIPPTPLEDLRLVLDPVFTFFSQMKVTLGHESCGGHVHVCLNGMEHLRDYPDALVRLFVRVQVALFRPLPERRKDDNEYCAWVEPEAINDVRARGSNALGRYTALNLLSVSKYNTAEFRLWPSPQNAKEAYIFAEASVRLVETANTLAATSASKERRYWESLSEETRSYFNKGGV